MRVTAALKSRKLAVQRAAGGGGEGEEAVPCLPVHGDPSSQAAGGPFQFPVQVGFHVLPSLGQAREPVGPEIDAGEEILAEPSLANPEGEVAVRARDELEVGASFLVRSHGKEPSLLDGAEQHGLLVSSQLGDLVEEENPSVGTGQEARPVIHGTGEGSLHVSEEGRHGAFAA